MYTAYIGQRLIDLHNAREGKTLTAREFFVTVYFPLFFGAERYLQHVNNSPFDQAYKMRSKKPLTPEIRAECLNRVHEKISGSRPDGSFFLGGAAADATAGTSGQVTDLELGIAQEEIYASWIGAALSVGIQGGLTLLIDADEVLLALFDGWPVYRQYMNQTESLKPHQINTWNGWWLTNAFGRFFDPGRPFSARQPNVSTDKTTGAVSLNTQSWIKVMFALARMLPERQVTAYVYSLSQMNTTVGFVMLELPKIWGELALYDRLFGSQGNLKQEGLDDLYATRFGFAQACEIGSIGLRALEPDKLRQYMPDGRSEGRLPKSLKPDDNELQITYNIYQTWIIAMLNNQDLLELAEQSADALQKLSETGARGKTGRKREVEQLLKAGNRRKFIEQLADIVEADGANKVLYDELVVHILKMPATDFPLLMALIKFKYAVARA